VEGEGGREQSWEELREDIQGILREGQKGREEERKEDDEMKSAGRVRGGS